MLFQVVELPRKQHLCKVKSLNKGDANSEVTVYYQVGNPPDGLILYRHILHLQYEPLTVPLLLFSMCWRCAPQSGLKNLREHALMELMVVSVETHSIPAAAYVLHFHLTCVHRCTWRSRVSTSSGQRRLWGQCHSSLHPTTHQTAGRTFEQTSSHSIQVPGVPHLQEHLRGAGILHHSGNTGHQVQVSCWLVLGAIAVRTENRFLFWYDMNFSYTDNTGLNSRNTSRRQNGVRVVFIAVPLKSHGTEHKC